MRTLAVIPARAGSERIPGKNIRPFCGRPIIAYSIDAALAAFGDVVVSTDSADIAKVAKLYGASVPFIRPAELSGPVVGIAPVLLHALGEMNKRGGAYTHVALLYACAPMLDAADLRSALRLSQDRDCSVLSVSRYTTPVERRLYIDPAGRVVPHSLESMQARTQDLPESYYDAAQFCIHREQAARSRAVAGWASPLPVMPYVLPAHKAVDIDTEEDWVRAEMAYAACKGGK